MCEEEEDETGFVRDALRNCEANWQIWGFEGGGDMEKATRAQIAYAEKLLRDLGYDIEDYPLSEMGKWEVSELIDELKDELYG